MTLSENGWLWAGKNMDTEIMQSFKSLILIAIKMDHKTKKEMLVGSHVWNT